VTSLGVFTIRHFADWGRRNTTYFAAFAGGVLLAASFLHLIPRALSLNVGAPAYITVGYFALLTFNRFITAFVCEKDPDKRECAIGIVPALGIGFHSFIDGFVYSITFSVSVLTGSLATVGLVLHEFPEGIITYILLLRGGFGKRRSLFLALAAAAVTTPMGMLISYPLVSAIGDKALGALLGLSAGSLIYVGASHLLPRAESDNKRYSLCAVFGGVLVAIAVVVTKT